MESRAEKKEGPEGQSKRQAYRAYQRAVAPRPGRAGYAGLDALARSAQAGDRVARDKLYAKIKEWLLLLANPALRASRQCASGRMEPADVRQQLFISFCELLRDWQPERVPFVVYTGAVLPNRLRHIVRGASKPLEVNLPDEPAGPDEAEDEDPPRLRPCEAATATDEATELATDPLICAEMLSGLDARSRRLMVLHVLDAWPMPEVAAALQVTERHAWRIYKAARLLLRARL